MNGRTAWITVAATLLMGACATPYEAPAVAMQPRVPPPESRDETRPRFCQLGTTCLALDPRPFTACLLATGRCPGKGQPMQVTESAPTR
jgi:hypothetical protein